MTLAGELALVFVMAFMLWHVRHSPTEYLFCPAVLANIGLDFAGGLRNGYALVSRRGGPKTGGLSKHTIHAWLSAGKLRRTKVGSRTMIRESELQRVIEDGGKSAVRPRFEAQ